ncbi:MAG TPA: universal stress protein [Caulobacterales bacterium]|nr:universal stress protein [Caulobacterales bacterium]
MSWRDFLAFVDGSEDGLARMKMAIDVAAAHKGRLEALVLVELPAPAVPVGQGMINEVLDEAIHKRRIAGQDAVEALQKIAAGASNVSVASWEVPNGQAREAAARAARTADLVIFGKPETLDDSDLDTDIFVGATLAGGRPCLMLPRWINPHSWGRRAVVSWKGTPEAARAVQGALPFLKQAEAVRLIVANPRGERDGEDEAGIARAVAYLQHHDVKVDGPVVRESWEGPERMVVSETEGFNADFLVIGAYESSRLQEEVFGGVTARVVRDATIPVLMAH